MITQSNILYDAHGLLIVDKPEGVLSHPNPGRSAHEGQRSTRCAFEGPYDFDARKFQTPEGPIWLIHRLDQDTSGVLIAARTAEIAKECRKLFEMNQIKKDYIGLVSGKIDPRKGFWNDHIIVERQKSRVRSKIIKHGAPNAKLNYELEKNFPVCKLGLIRIELITGKTHQIRVQAAFRKHAIIGDEIYGDFSLNKELRKKFGIRRLFLHAIAIEMKHPATQEHLRIESPLPDKLAQALELLQ